MTPDAMKSAQPRVSHVGPARRVAEHVGADHHERVYKAQEAA